MKRVPIICRNPIKVEYKDKSEITQHYGYIYITTNLVNNKRYLGQHKNNTEGNYVGSGLLLHRAINKYGKENFVSEPIDWAESKEELDQKEIWWIDILGAAESEDWYNIAYGGNSGKHLLGKNNPMYGVHRPHSEEEKEHQRKIMMNHKVTEETREKLREAMNKNKDLYKQNGKDNPFYGHSHSEEQKSKWRKEKGTPVVQLTLNGEFINKFDSMSEPEYLGFSHTYISNCCKGKQEKHKGYKWMYLEDYLSQGGRIDD